MPDSNRGQRMHLTVSVYNDRVKAIFAAGRWLLVLLVLAACAGELNTPGEALRILGGNLPDAHLGEPYEEAISVAGGLRPYSYELSGGELPPGISLEGPNLRGVPSQLGNFTFSVTASDANLSSTVLEHRLRVVELPPPALAVVMPETEARAPFTIRVNVEEARDLHGLRSRLRWDPAQFSYVEGSLAAPGTNYALFSAVGTDWLQVDVAWLATTFTGDRLVFSFQLRPLAPTRPGLAVETEFRLDSAAGSSFELTGFGARVAAPAATPVEAPAEQPEAGSLTEEEPEDSGSSRQAPPDQGDAPADGQSQPEEPEENR